MKNNKKLPPRIYKDCNPHRLRPDYDFAEVGEVLTQDYTDLIRCVSLIEKGDILVFNRGTLWYEAVKVQKLKCGGELVFIHVHWKYMGRFHK